ncbi:hypothetical protein V8C86DRAFT_1490609 [Haematococcus lacustris]
MPAWAGCCWQFADVDEVVEALAPYLQPAKARCGDKPFLAVYGGDPAHVATIGAVVRAVKARYGCHVLAIQAAGSPETWTDAVFVCEEQHEVVHRTEGGLLVEQRQVLYGGVRDGKPVGGARYYMGDVFYGRPCEGLQGRVRLTFFLGGGAIAAEELAYADSQGAPWVYLPCRCKNVAVYSSAFGPVHDWVVHKLAHGTGRLALTGNAPAQP